MKNFFKKVGRNLKESIVKFKMIKGKSGKEALDISSNEFKKIFNFHFLSNSILLKFK